VRLTSRLSPKPRTEERVRAAPSGLDLVFGENRNVPGAERDARSVRHAADANALGGIVPISCAMLCFFAGQGGQTK